ncbi:MULTISPECIES: hypothetical protein [Streptomyces]|uniref:hypothetical protein n=1 Tax=Streptomyces TaxID=1883 RepID=UPI001D155F55|nr:MULTISPECIES: hypothetical protein [Streptomyces]MCC3655157.1 hypothetical protein [Streptomyces sp. S07_1.15]WSQ70518.1 hypothetical protein OG463_03130 [Streptomyces xinghaiensis]
MAGTVERAVSRTHGRRALGAVGVVLRTPSAGTAASGTRHPLVAAAMVLPLAVVLTVVFGGWEAVMTQASSVAGLLGR